MINNPDNVIDELMSGYVAAYPEYIRRSELHQRALIGKKRNPQRKTGKKVSWKEPILNLIRR